jgi:hypothetical protein
MIHTLVLASSLGAALPNPHPVAPPGSEGFLTILNFAMWVLLALCILALMVTGAMMGFNARRGQGGEHASALGWVLAGSIVIGSASGIIGVLTVPA